MLNPLHILASIVAISALLAASAVLTSLPASADSNAKGNDDSIKVKERCGRCWVVQPGETYQTTINDDGQLVKLSCTIQTKNVNGHIGMACDELN
jgi:hypothetical protein